MSACGCATHLSRPGPRGTAVGSLPKGGEQRHGSQILMTYLTYLIDSHVMFHIVSVICGSYALVFLVWWWNFQLSQQKRFSVVVLQFQFWCKWKSRGSGRFWFKCKLLSFCNVLHWIFEVTIQCKLQGRHECNQSAEVLDNTWKLSHTCVYRIA